MGSGGAAVRLVSVYSHVGADKLLYALLQERNGQHDVNISHRQLPSFERHREFVQSSPYAAWYLIQVEDVFVGSIYLTRRRRSNRPGDEIGIHLFQRFQRHGYGPAAIRALLSKHGRRTYFANINPKNERSVHIFTKLGFELRQVTLALEVK